MNNFRVAWPCYTALSVVANLPVLVICLPFRRVSIKHLALLGAGLDQVNCTAPTAINALPSFTLQSGDAIGPLERDAGGLSRYATSLPRGDTRRAGLALQERSDVIA
jgi:hypothetical protein